MHEVKVKDVSENMKSHMCVCVQKSVIGGWGGTRTAAVTSDEDRVRSQNPEILNQEPLVLLDLLASHVQVGVKVFPT